MQVIHVHTGPNDLTKFRKRVAPFRPAGLVRCQVAGNDVWTWPEWTEVVAAAQIGRWIDLDLARKGAHGWPEKVWVSGRSELGRGAVFWEERVATIAVRLCVDNVAAQSHQLPVFSIKIQSDRGYLESLSNLGFLPVIIVCVYARRTERYSDSDHKSECRPGSNDLRELTH